jgi:ADP-ribosylglycohydrolase
MTHNETGLAVQGPTEASTVDPVDRFCGCLVGQALGDALGFPVEGYPPETCAAYVEDVLRPWDLERAVRSPFLFGQYTDDTQLARELALSLVERRGFDPDDFAGRLAALFVEERVVGRGAATEAAARRIAAGVPWIEAGAPAPSAGNGSAMRAAPVGLLYRDDPVRLIEAAREQGYVTHQDPRSSAGAIAIAGAVALVTRGEHRSPVEFCGQLAEWVADDDGILAAELRGLPGLLRRDPAEVVQPIGRAGFKRGYTTEWEGISPFVTPSVLWSLYAFLRSPEDYWEAVCTAIAVGGDVDTTAAMTGAIAGAALGLGGLPLDLARQVNDRGRWGFEELRRLAEALFAAEPPSEVYG